MAQLPYFPCYPSDVLGSATFNRLTLEEGGAHFLLLCHGWLGDGIPADRRDLALMLGLRPGAERTERVLTRVLDLGWKPDPDDPRKLRNDRQERERAIAEAKYTAAVNNMAKARAANPKNQHPPRERTKPTLKRETSPGRKTGNGQPTHIESTINVLNKPLNNALSNDQRENQNQNHKQQLAHANGNSDSPPADPDDFGRQWREQLGSAP